VHDLERVLAGRMCLPTGTPRPSSRTTTVPSGRIVTIDGGGVAGHRLVDRVVDDLPDEVVEPAPVGRADVHARATTDRLEALEDLDAGRGVVAPAGPSARRSAVGLRGPRAVADSVTQSLRSGARRAVPAPRRCSTRSRSGRRDGIGEAYLGPKRVRRSSSTRSRSGSGRSRAVAVRFARLAQPRTSSSVWRTDRSCPMTARRTCAWPSTGRPPSARPWPSVIRRPRWPTAPPVRGRGGGACWPRWSAPPTRSATASCVRTRTRR
jgi:hypothetical protein